MKRLVFLADPADIVDARKVLRVSDEDEYSVTLLENTSNLDREFFVSAKEIINYYRGV